MLFKWESNGYIRRTATKPKCVSPLSVARKFDLQNNIVKKRLCLDLSRHINYHLADNPVKLSDLRNCQCLIAKGDYQMCMDLENAFFHIKVNESHQDYLGFKWFDENANVDVYYVFTVMVYGIKPAVSIITRIIKPIVSFLHSHGVKYSIYIDDGRTSASSGELTLAQHNLAIETFKAAGWNIQQSKTSVMPTQVLLYQGVITDSRHMLYRLPEYKKIHLKNSLLSLLSIAQNDSEIDLRSLAKVAGTLASCDFALGPVIRVMARSFHSFIASQALTGGWDISVKIPSLIAQDLSSVYQNIDIENGQPLINEKSGRSLNEILGYANPRIPTAADKIYRRFIIG